MCHIALAKGCSEDVPAGWAPIEITGHLRPLVALSTSMVFAFSGCDVPRLSSLPRCVKNRNRCVLEVHGMWMSAFEYPHLLGLVALPGLRHKEILDAEAARSMEAGGIRERAGKDGVSCPSTCSLLGIRKPCR